MIRRISSLLADTVVKTKKISNQEREIYEYCLYVVFNHLIYALIMLFTGIITHRFYISFIFLLTLIPLRMFFGGAHASKPWICTFLSYGIGVLLIVIIPNYYNYIPEFVIPVLMLMSMIPIILLAPVDNKRKCFSPQQRKNLRIICNQFIVSNLSGVFDSDTSYAVSDFQTFMCLNNDSAVTLGSVNRRTWGALLWSKGDTERDFNAIDTSKRLTIPFCSYLYQQGIRYIGRYLTKLSETSEKNMTADEITIIHNSGFNIIPLFQENNNIADDFSYLKGYESWNKAILAATKLRIPPSIIYFCVDFDVTEYQAETIVKDFFQGINDAKNVNPSIYQIGINIITACCKSFTEIIMHEFSLVI